MTQCVMDYNTRNGEGCQIRATQLTDLDVEEVRVGMPVEKVTRRLREYGEGGLIVYEHKFRPGLKDQI
jgi:uncharacterized OB-fold protein